MIWWRFFPPDTNIKNQLKTQSIYRYKNTYVKIHFHTLHSITLHFHFHSITCIRAQKKTVNLFSRKFRSKNPKCAKRRINCCICTPLLASNEVRPSGGAEPRAEPTATCNVPFRIGLINNSDDPPKRGLFGTKAGGCLAKLVEQQRPDFTSFRMVGERLTLYSDISDHSKNWAIGFS